MDEEAGQQVDKSSPTLSPTLYSPTSPAQHGPEEPTIFSPTDVAKCLVCRHVCFGNCLKLFLFYCDALLRPIDAPSAVAPAADSRQVWL